MKQTSIYHLNDEELIIIFKLLPFKILVGIIPQVCTKWKLISESIKDVLPGRKLANILHNKQYLSQSISHIIIHTPEISNNSEWRRLSVKLYPTFFNNIKKITFDKHFINNQYIVDDEYMRNCLQLLPQLEKLDILSIIDIKKIPKINASQYINKLVIRYCLNITDFSAIKELTNLQEFWIRNSKIKNLSFLENSLNIKEIMLKNCHELSDISIITKFKLDYFHLSNCQGIIDVSLFSQCDIKYIYIKESVIRDFSSLGDLPFLEKLTIINNIFVDSLLCLKDNYQLKNLTIINCPNITNVSFIKENSKLEILQLNKIGANDLSPIVNCGNLTTLSLAHFNTVEIDVSFFENLHYLEHLTLMSCSIYELQVLENCLLLEELAIENCEIENIDFLKGMSNLDYLQLKNIESIIDVSVLKNCSNLKDIDIINCPLIEDISCLKYCSKLVEVYISDCPNLRKMYHDLQQQLPTTKIYIR